MATEGSSTSSKMVVAAIDFGTTYSGYAYSFIGTWPKAITNRWESGNSTSFKTPTILLLNPDQTFHSFGYDAEMNYADIAEEGDEEGRTCKEYYLFKHFKMFLKDCLSKRVHRETKCSDEYGREVNAIQVFIHSIRYLKNHLIQALNKSTTGVEVTEKDINFVLTVPAIWDDTAKMFMHEAAKKAGIPEKQLDIALEPEAASIYCQLMHLDDIQRDNTSEKWERASGVNYMVIDLGGGTADITVHQLQEDGTLAELLPASGGELGGTCVDKAYYQFLEDVFGKNALEDWKTNPATIADYIEFWQKFEVRKREPTHLKSNKVYLNIPLALTEIAAEKLNIAQERGHAIILKEILKRSKYSENKDISCETGKLIVSTEIFRGFFNPTIDKLMDLIVRMERDLASELDMVLLVGGFSDCSLIQEKIRLHFGQERLVIPFETSLAVLKGAVFYGHRQDLISRRVARFTYGMQIWPKFDASVHSLNRKEIVDGEERCRNIFLKFVSKGDPMEPGLRKSYIFNPLKRGKNHLECGVFISNRKDPKYVDDPGCFKLGALTMPMRNFESQSSFEIEETLIFGETYIKVEACNRRTNERYEVTFDLLSPKLNVPANR